MTQSAGPAQGNLFDQHLHSRHSFDSRTEPADNVEAAIARGLAGLTFTEHFDTHPDDWDSCVYDDAAYSSAIQNLRRRFGRRIWIGKGIEVCFQPQQMDFILNFLDRHDFDLVMLSVHYFGGRPVHRRESWHNRTVAEGTELYLRSVLDAARFCEQLHRRRGPVFHVLGHLDMVKRYTQRFFGTFDLSPFGRVLDAILTACLEGDLIPEINTSTLRQGLPEPMPRPDVLARYARLGGTTVTLGSDAHAPQDIGADFDRALELIRTIGLRYLAHFRNRQRETIDLDRRSPA